MKELKTVLAELGLTDVQTYIQSGNVVFQSGRTDLPTLAEEISVAIGQSHGFAPQVMLLHLADLKTAVSRNPFPAIYINDW